jgi:hypothetical protein
MGSDLEPTLPQPWFKRNQWQITLVLAAAMILSVALFVWSFFGGPVSEVRAFVPLGITGAFLSFLILGLMLREDARTRREGP